MGVVYEALDRERGSHVALKTLRSLDPGGLYRFKQEFRTLADVSHPNLVTLHELVSSPSGWFFTMQLVEGLDFLSWVRPHGAVPEGVPVQNASVGAQHMDDSGDALTLPLLPHDTLEERSASTMHLDDPRIARSMVVHGRAAGPPPDFLRLRDALGQLAEGVSALHAGGKLHRDIKPSNVLVTNEGRVIILDFGLATELLGSDTQASTAGRIVGTIAYMSPEQCAGHPATVESDWYSVGVMLYLALVGCLPFVGPAVKVLGSKQRMDAPSPSQLVRGLPQDLDALCTALLSRRPADRPRGQDVLRMLGAGDLLMTGTHPKARRSVTQVLVGREEPLALLQQALEATRRGAPVTVYVRGRSGMGKTALVQAFLDEIESRDEALILRGRAYEREMVPYKAVDSLIDELTRHLVRLPRAALDALIPRDIEALATVFPVLMRVRALSEAPRRMQAAPSPVQLRRRAFLALREILDNLARTQPLILHIDDLQWGDPDSASLLTEVLQPPRAPSLLLIGCYRSEDVSTSPMLRALLSAGPRVEEGADVREVAVRPLGFEDAHRLALWLLRKDDDAAREQAAAIAYEANGSPFLVSELSRWARRRRASAGTSTHLRSPVGPGNERADVTLERVVDERLAELPDTAPRLLELLAVAGRPVELTVLAHLAPDRMHDAVAALRSSRLIRTSSRAGRDVAETYHDRIREVLVSRIDEAGLRARHLALAQAHEGAGVADPEAMALHYQAAGDAVRGAHYAELAADRAAAALAFDHAAKLYQRVLQQRRHGPADARRLRGRLGDALANAGRGADAARAYLQAAECATGTDELELERRAGEQLLRCGYIDDGVVVMRRVLATMGLAYPDSPRDARNALIARRAQIRIRGLRFRERDESMISPDVLARIDVAWTMAMGLGAVDAIRATDYETRHLLLALKAGEPYRVARALCAEATMLAADGAKSAKRVRRVLDQARELSQRIDSLHAIGLVVVTAGAASFLQGQWRSALEWCDRAEAILSDLCTGAAWELVTAQIFGLRARFFLGEIAMLAQRVPVLLAYADERGDRYATTSLRQGYLNLAWLARGDAETALQEVRKGSATWSSDGFHVQHFAAILAEAHVYLYDAVGPRAHDLVQNAWPALERSMLMRVQYVRVEAYYLRARCALGAALRTTYALELVARAETDAQRIAREKLPWADPTANMIWAVAASARGETSRAIAQFGQAEDGFVAADMPLHANVARRRLGRLIGGAAGAKMVEQTEDWLRNQGIRHPDRFAEIFAPGSFDPRRR